MFFVLYPHKVREKKYFYGFTFHSITFCLISQFLSKSRTNELSSCIRVGVGVCKHIRIDLPFNPFHAHHSLIFNSPSYWLWIQSFRRKEQFSGSGLLITRRSNSRVTPKIFTDELKLCPFSKKNPSHFPLKRRNLYSRIIFSTFVFEMEDLKGKKDSRPQQRRSRKGSQFHFIATLEPLYGSI